MSRKLPRAGMPGVVDEQPDRRMPFEHASGDLVDLRAVGDVADLPLAADLARDPLELARHVARGARSASRASRSSRAVASPMPDEAPVITATRSSAMASETN